MNGAGARLGRRQGTGPGALVVGGDYQGLGIARSLGRRGVPVVVIDDERSIARFSRHVAHAVPASDLRDQDRAVRALIEAGERLGLAGWVLYPTREETVAAISHNRDHLSGLYKVPTPSWDAVRWAWDKRNTYELAGRLGVPAPRTWYPKEPSDLDAIEGDPPFVVKPAIKEDFVHATKQKAWLASSRQELVELFRRADAVVRPGEVMIQELIPGGGSQQFAYCAFFKNGEAIGEMTAARVRQHPPMFGKASTYARTVDIPELVECSRRMLTEIGYYGLVELEYKLDPRDGRYKVLDFNARTWGYHTLGRAAGVDFPYMLFADQMGQAVEPRQARPGVTWVRTLTDLPTAVVEWRAGRLGIGSYLSQMRRADTEAVFSLGDPLPGLVEVALIPYLALTRGF